MYVMILICNVGDFYEEMVLSLTRRTLSYLENASYFSFDEENMICVSGGKIFLEIL